MNHRRFTVGAAGLALLTLAAGHSFAQAIPPNYPANYQEILEASKNEGKLLIYHAMDNDAWDAVIPAFNKLYPWIDVSLLALSAAEVIERHLAEAGSGREAGDLLVTTAPGALIDLQENGYIEPYDSPEHGPYEDWSNPLPGVYTMSADPIILLWNKALLPPELVPDSMAELVRNAKENPEIFNGKLTTYAAHVNTFGYTIQYTLANHHDEQYWEWMEVLGPLTRVERGSGPMSEKVASGEYLIAYLTGSSTAFENIDKPGADRLLGWSFIKDGTPLVPRDVAIPTHATNPNSARLMLDFILSRDGQIALSPSKRTVVYPGLRKEDVGGVYTYESVAEEIGTDNMLTPAYDKKMVTGYDAFMARWKKAFGL